MTLYNIPQPTPRHPGPALTLPGSYEAPTLTPLGAWTAVTLVISVPVGLSNVYNASPFDKEF